MKSYIRPALAIFWSVAWVVIYLLTKELPPEFVSGLTLTTVGWWFASRQREKANKKVGK